MENIIQVIEEILSSYDLQPFVFDIVWVCDRQSSLKKTFYQTEIDEAKKDTVFGDYYIDSIDDDDDQINGSNSEEDDSSCDDDKLLNKRTTSVSYTSTTPSPINVLTILAQLLLVSKRILVTIIQYKELVKSLNPFLEIFNEKNLNKERINIIISSILDKIIDFLKPWTHIKKRIQSLQVPSIHTVTPSIDFLRQREQQYVKSSANKKPVSLSTNALFLNVTDFYLNVEFVDEDHADQYATTRVLAVPATSAPVEREFSFTDNTITQKRSKLSPDSVNDIVFNH
ncbi:unnamed protein product [Rotaria sordida]|uniref:HAT C-terminal dimerisation domain-containing protein n=1 Tax=Rotaria sordida TaxID=392033 RepID=A0A814YJ37_9BILA|nr:unnamed protein product [Rotaria sordida]CAF1230212.1 unnamed protein product [Rotaria sordida]CAF1512063.1 unnamed protein product [Rotaria sordida]CAF1512232.1 unnamed protein product [Rotaria sordida]